MTERESEGCTCCQTRTFTNYSVRVLNGAECPHCGHLVRSHTREVADLLAERESEGCTCCQVSTESTRADEDECPSCGHLMRFHTRSYEGEVEET